MLAYLALAGLNAMVVPVGQTGYQNAPDEAAHVAYVRSLAHWRLPTRETSAGPFGYEWHQPPLYYLAAAPLLQFGPHAVRAFSIAIGALCLLLIYRTGRALFPDDPALSVLAVAIAGLAPAHVAILSSVGNDGLEELCFSATLYALIVMLHSGVNSWRAGWLGVAVGAAILTKATGLLLLPVCLIAAFMLRRVGEKPADIGRAAVWSAFVAFAVCGWWFFRNERLYGEWLPLRAFAESFAGTVTAAKVISGAVPIPGVQDWSSYLVVVALWTFKSFWAVYGTARSALIGAPRFLDDRIYLLLGAASACALAGLAKAHFSPRESFTQTQRLGMRLLFICACLVAVAFCGFVLRYFQTQGRYLYPAMLPISIAFALGWRSLFPAKYVEIASAALVALLLATALLYGIIIAA
jgi:hypothetical protein